MSVLLKDVAEKVNMSITTVSLVLNGKPVRVSEKKRRLILKTASEMDYKPNQAAQSLVTKKTMTIGLIIPDICNLFFSEFVKFVGEKLKAQNYYLLLCNSNHFVDEEINQMELLRMKSVDGMLVIFSDTNADKYVGELEKLKRANIPIVIMDQFEESLDVKGVGVDDELGGYLATRHLIENNHTHIACITGPDYAFSSAKRFAGYCRALEETGIPFNKDYVFKGDFKFASGELLGAEILKRKEITAVFAENDMMALGLYRAMTKAGKRIGKDISIVGFDDILYTSMLDVPLTTINQNVQDVAENAVSLLLSMVKNQPLGREIHYTRPHLVERDSVARLEKRR